MPAHTPAPRLPHYIGITGVQSPTEVIQLSQSASRFQIGEGYSHALMLGALVSPATSRNGTPVHTNKPCRHIPSREVLRDTLLATKDLHVLGMLHFELHKAWPGTRGDAAEVIDLLSFLAKDSMAPPVQLNGVIVPAEIRQIHDETGVPLVLQMRPELTSRSDDELMRYLEEIAPATSMILMDPSAGAGQSIDLEPTIRLYHTIQGRFPNRFTFGFAGGLGGITEHQIAHTTHVVRELRSRLGSSEFSIDVESNVRLPATATGDDHLDHTLCEAYLGAVRSGLDI
jgi:hypothetical protein